MILNNFLSNAIKYTDEGQLVLTIDFVVQALLWKYRIRE
ncbi:MAG: signal transduction histidine kinase [Algoriphagus sp.]|jgi:signal transduction histidine kinase